MIIDSDTLQELTVFLKGLNDLSNETGIYIDSYSQAVQLKMAGEILGLLKDVDGTAEYGFEQ